MSQPPTTQAAGDSYHDGRGHAVHVLPVRVLLAVFAVLAALTFLTVAATWVDLGSGNLVVALAIATVKATLVALYFMHLRYDSPFHALVFIAGLAFLALFLWLTLVDATTYQVDIESFRGAIPAP